MDHVSMVKDLDDFYLYPWGTVAYANILRFIKNAVKNNETRDEPLPKAYHLVDFPRAIVVFIFEIILALEEQEFAKRTAAHYPQRIANWNYEAGANWKALEKQVFDSKQLSMKKLSHVTFYNKICYIL